MIFLYFLLRKFFECKHLAACFDHDSMADFSLQIPTRLTDIGMLFCAQLSTVMSSCLSTAKPATQLCCFCRRTHVPALQFNKNRVSCNMFALFGRGDGKTNEREKISFYSSSNDGNFSHYDRARNLISPIAGSYRGPWMPS